MYLKTSYIPMQIHTPFLNPLKQKQFCKSTEVRIINTTQPCAFLMSILSLALWFGNFPLLETVISPKEAVAVCLAMFKYYQVLVEGIADPTWVESTIAVTWCVQKKNYGHGYRQQ